MWPDPLSALAVPPLSDYSAVHTQIHIRMLPIAVLSSAGVVSPSELSARASPAASVSSFSYLPCGNCGDQEGC